MLFCIKPKLCVVLQLEAKISSLDYKSGSQVFKLYEKQIVKSSKKVRDIFTVDNIAVGFANLRHLGFIIDNNKSQTKSLKLPVYQNLINPCFLLVVCFEVSFNHRKYTSYVQFLETLLSLSFCFFHKTYSPNPIKRVFIKGFRGNMCPFSLASLKDNILQQVLKFVLTPRFKQGISCFLS
jgi:hypothetical protein